MENGVWAETSDKATDNNGATQRPVGSGTMDPSGPPSSGWGEGGKSLWDGDAARGRGEPSATPGQRKGCRRKGYADHANTGAASGEGSNAAGPRRPR